MPVVHIPGGPSYLLPAMDIMRAQMVDKLQEEEEVAKLAEAISKSLHRILAHTERTTVLHKDGSRSEREEPELVARTKREVVDFVSIFPEMLRAKQLQQLLNARRESAIDLVRSVDHVHGGCVTGKAMAGLLMCPENVQMLRMLLQNSEQERNEQAKERAQISYWWHMGITVGFVAVLLIFTMSTMSTLYYFVHGFAPRVLPIHENTLLHEGLATGVAVLGTIWILWRSVFGQLLPMYMGLDIRDVQSRMHACVRAYIFLAKRFNMSLPISDRAASLEQACRKQLHMWSMRLALCRIRTHIGCGQIEAPALYALMDGLENIVDGGSGASGDELDGEWHVFPGTAEEADEFMGLHVDESKGEGPTCEPNADDEAFVRAYEQEKAHLCATAATMGSFLLAEVAASPAPAPVHTSTNPSTTRSSSSSSSGVISASVCSADGCITIAVNECAGCRLVGYCSRQCQTKHWKQGGHKQQCRLWQQAKEEAGSEDEIEWDDDDDGDEAAQPASESPSTEGPRRRRKGKASKAKIDKGLKERSTEFSEKVSQQQPQQQPQQQHQSGQRVASPAAAAVGAAGATSLHGHSQRKGARSRERDVRSLLEAGGWVIKRQKNHVVWKRQSVDGQTQTYTESKTPRGSRVHRRRAALLRRLDSNWAKAITGQST
jgi:hypothetical protein